MSYVVTARWTAAPGNEQAVRDAISNLAGPTRDEPGCLEYRAHQSLDDPNVFLLYEVYVDEAAYQAHGSSEHFRQHAIERGIPLLAERKREFFAPLDDA
jgi:quinol monooxygenase YgiN